MIQNALDVLVVGLLTCWAIAIGRVVLRAFKTLPTTPSDQCALGAAMGLGCLALSVMLLAQCGLLHRAGIVFVLGVGALVVWVDWRVHRSVGHARSDALSSVSNREINVAKFLRGQKPADRSNDVLGRALDVLGIVVLVATFLATLVPVTDGDALCYHLQVPKVFLQKQCAWFDPDLHETIYPLVTEMLFASVLAFRGATACRLMSWVLGVVFAGCVTALARPVLGRNARHAGVLALLVPAISNGMSAPLNDVALASFCAAALVGWVRWCECPRWGSAASFGILCGFAIGVKYPALVWVGLLGIASLLVVMRRIRTGAGSWGQLTMQGIVAFSTCLLVGGIWYARAYHFTGNPVFPFFKQVFGGAGLDVVLEPAKRPLVVHPWNLLTALWPVTLEPDRFDSVAHQFGPLFLMLLPVMFLLRAPGRVWAMALLGMGFFMACMTQRQSMRFLLAAVGPWSVAVAWVVHALWELRSFAARCAGVLAVVVLGFQTAQAVARLRAGGGVVLGRETPEAYLARVEPTFEVGRWIERNLPADCRMIGQDHRGFYIPRPYTMELAHRRRTGLGSASEDASTLVATLQARGFTHLLLCPPVPENAVEFDPTIGRLLSEWTSARVPAYRRELRDGDGVTRMYAIYELAGPTRVASHAEMRRQ